MYYVDPVCIAVTNLLEATEINGRSLNFDYANLPSGIKQRAVEKLQKERGISKEEAEKALSRNYELFSSDEKEDRVSLLGKDSIESAMLYALEAYDKETDELILHSDDIVKAYNAAINAHFEECQKALEHLQAATDKDDAKERKMSLLGTSLTSAVGVVGSFKSHVYFEHLSDADKKKIICEAAYTPSEDPEEIKAIVDARIKYNNLVIGLLKTMLHVNYAILGLSKDQAEALSQKLDSKNQGDRQTAIKDVKKIVAENEAKFRKGNMIDLRPLGGGVLLVTDKDLGNVKDYVKLDRVLQLIMTHDVVCVGHGNSENAKVREATDKVHAEHKKRLEEMDRENQADLDKVAKMKANLEQYAKEFKEREFPKTLWGQYKLAKQKADDAYDAVDELIASHKKYKASVEEKRMMLGQHLANGDIDQATYDKQLAELEDLAKKEQAEYKKQYVKLQDECEEFDELYAKLKKEVNSSGATPVGTPVPKDDPTYIQMKKELDDFTSGIDSRKEKRKKEISVWYNKEADKVAEITAKYGNDRRWVIQSIKTPSGSTYTDVNELIKGLAKEGYKKILLIACNPGHHELDPDVRALKDVTIHFAKDSLLAETADPAFDSCMQTLQECEEFLIESCDESGLGYNSISLTEAMVEYNSFLIDDYRQLNEGTISGIWERLKALVKKALEILVGIFKKFIDLVKRIITKIVNFFKRMFEKHRERKFIRKVKSGRVLVEAAHTDKFEASSWDDLKKNTVSACESISKKIQQMERSQVTNMQTLERYTEQKSRTFHENAHPELDKVTALLFS